MFVKLLWITLSYLIVYSNANSTEIVDIVDIVTESPEDQNDLANYPDNGLIYFLSQLLSSLGNLFSILTDNRGIVEGTIYLVRESFNLMLTLFDRIRWKYSWFKNEISYVQCVSDSLLKAHFASRHFNVLVKIIYEFLGFVQNVLADGFEESMEAIIDTVNVSTPEDIGLESDGKVSEIITARARAETESLMATDTFLVCSTNYLNSIFVRVLRVLYGEFK